MGLSLSVGYLAWLKKEDCDPEAVSWLREELARVNRVRSYAHLPSGKCGAGLGSGGSRVIHGRARYWATARRTTDILASSHVVHRHQLYAARRTKARIARPMWLRCAWPRRAWQRSTPQCCFSPRWYSSMRQL